MKVAVVSVLALPVLLALVASVFGVVRTSKTQHDANQRAFLGARPPDPPPHGLYKGSVGKDVSWKGKSFDSSASRGINIFEKNGAREKRYPFRTYVGRGLRDKKIDVLKIDYDIEGNPWWLRRVLDEVVEVEPGRYLGKIHVRWLLGINFAVGYFRLEPAAAAVEPAPAGEAQADAASSSGS
jgi:hypothetical protein